MGRFLSAVKTLSEQANKSVRRVISQSKSNDFPVDLQLKLFDNIVMPILFYGSEVWGYENSALVEKVELNFKTSTKCKKVNPTLHGVW